jgi:hypothetical protein
MTYEGRFPSGNAWLTPRAAPAIALGNGAEREMAEKTPE